MLCSLFFSIPFFILLNSHVIERDTFLFPSIKSRFLIGIWLLILGWLCNEIVLSLEVFYQWGQHRWRSSVNIKSCSWELAPLNQLGLDLIHCRHDRLFSSLNWDDFSYFLIIEAISKRLCLQVRKLHQEIHATITLGNKFFVACWFEYLGLQRYHADHDAIDALYPKVLSNECVPSVWSLISCFMIDEITVCKSLLVFNLPYFSEANISQDFHLLDYRHLEANLKEEIKESIRHEIGLDHLENIPFTIGALYLLLFLLLLLKCLWCKLLFQLNKLLLFIPQI